MDPSLGAGHLERRGREVKITPLDIRRKEFKRSMRGYSDEEVDIFLDEVADEFERLFQENIELQDRSQRLEDQIATYTQVREALEKTLISAQLQADEIKANANRESELVLKDAQLKARGIVNDSYTESQQVQKTLVGLKRLEEEFRFKFRSLLEGYLNLLGEAPISTGARETPVEETVGEAVAVGSATAAVSIAAVPEAVVAEAVVAEEAATGSESALQVESEAMGAASESEPIGESEPASQPEPAPQPEPASQAEPPREPTSWPEDEVPTEESAFAEADAAADATAHVGAASQPASEEAVEAALEEAVEAESERAANDAVVDADTLEEETLETSPGNARPEDDQTSLDDSRQGFFFGRQLEDIDDTFPGEEVIRKDRTRDFEW